MHSHVNQTISNAIYRSLFKRTKATYKSYNQPTIEMDVAVETVSWTLVLIGTMILIGCTCLFWNWKSSTPRYRPQDKSQDESQTPLQLQPPIKLNLKDFITNNVFFPIQFQSRGSSFEDSTDGSDPMFDGFIIEQVIPKAENQRKNWQFACLMLRGEHETQNQQFIYKPHHGSNPYVNDNEAFSPPVERLNNYIIARPHGQKHAEEVILDNFKTLWRAYMSKNRNQKPVSVVLYSWIIPCVTCTSNIIKSLSKLEVPVHIAYTIKYHCETEQQRQNSVRRIEESGMVIDQVRCQERLKPKHY